MQLTPVYLWKSEALGAEGLADNVALARAGATEVIIESGVDEAVVTVALVLYSFGFDEYRACGEVTRWAARSCPDGTVAWQPCVPGPGLEAA